MSQMQAQGGGSAPSSAVTVSLEGSIAVAFVLIAEIPILTALRFWVMRHNQRTLSRTVSDGFFLLYGALIIATGCILFTNMFNEKRYGALAVTENYMKNVFVIGLLYTCQMWSIKAAFLALYFGIINNLTRKLQICLYITAGWLVFTFLANFLFQMLYCRPFYTFWAVGPNACSSIMSAPGTIVTSWTNITGDLAILFIGLAIIANLHVSRSEKYAMVVVSCIGMTSIVSTLIRFVLCYRMALAAGDGTLDLIHSINTWSVMELLMAHIAFCMLAFKALLNRRKDSQEKNASQDWSRVSRGSGRRGITVSHSFDLESLKTGSQTELRPMGLGNNVSN